MAYFAEVKNGIVQRVIVADQDFINSGAVGDPLDWVETHKKNKSARRALKKKNPAFRGATYDPVRQDFIAPKPYASWVLDEAKLVWEPPVPRPANPEKYRWNENNKNWELWQQ